MTQRMTIEEFLRLWRKDKTALPKYIRFREERFSWSETDEDYICDISDPYGYHNCLWDFIDRPEILDEEVELL